MTLKPGAEFGFRCCSISIFLQFMSFAVLGPLLAQSDVGDIAHEKTFLHNLARMGRVS